MDKQTRAEYARIRAQGWPAKHALDVARYHAKMRRSPFWRACDGETVDYKGRRFTVHVAYDDFGEKPWENCEPLADVAEHKGAGSQLPRGHVWLVQPDNRHYGHSYDRAAALRNVQSWGALYHGALAVHIVDGEEQRFAAWLRDDWHYCTLGLELDGETDYIGGIEDDGAEHIAETLEDMAEGLIRHADELDRRAMLARCFL